MNKQTRYLTNYLLCKKLGMLYQSIPGEAEIQAWQQGQKQRQANREKLRALSEVPLNELDETCQQWLLENLR